MFSMCKIDLFYKSKHMLTVVSYVKTICYSSKQVVMNQSLNL